MSIQITEIKKLSDFEQLIKSSEKHFILCDFYADFCGPCKNIEKVLPEIYYPHNSKFDFIKINIENDEFSDLIDHCNVKKVPTFVAFKSKTEKEFTDTITTANVQQLKNFINTIVPININDDDADDENF